MIDESLDLLDESFGVLIVLVANDDISSGDCFFIRELIFVKSRKPKHNKVRIVAALLVSDHGNFQTNQVILNGLDLKLMKSLIRSSVNIFLGQVRVPLPIDQVNVLVGLAVDSRVQRKVHFVGFVLIVSVLEVFEKGDEILQEDAVLLVAS